MERRKQIMKNIMENACLYNIYTDKNITYINRSDIINFFGNAKYQHVLNGKI